MIILLAAHHDPLRGILNICKLKNVVLTMKPAATKLSMIPVKQLCTSFFTKIIKRIPTSCLDMSYARRSQLQASAVITEWFTFSYRSALSPKAAKMAVVQASSLAVPVK